MAAKKKATKKKVAKKKNSRKTVVPKRKPEKNKTAKKKTVKRKNVITKKAAKKNAPARKKTTPKKKSSPAKKAIPITQRVTIPPVLPKAKPLPSSRGIVETEKWGGIVLDVTFKLGAGHLEATLIHKGNVIESKEISDSGKIEFNTCEKGDIISLNGSCSGTATIDANRKTLPATPLKFQDEMIISSLDIE